ncbi:succinate dehydrogenase cytochrome b560 subunit, mitochondrial [Drosophila guanche]|uniref:Blast:Succinate dehydrogenase cytochrome b560 subunit, mitochondrial n=1 Tax=Drosophila guanche TaxID=7266 RepID=A0A3B0K606_DROGU|nr:succinate dehydrogenase cytochrome b560 subunit, mitochondrial [Drosophila guanche]SPP83490.1 blast:Succinate dehydrogenase cytochrome b560 subunit%2C mitochondrial [Drosophila guanche]
MYAARCVTRSLPGCTSYLQQMLRQKPLVRAHNFRYLSGKNAGKPPPAAGGAAAVAVAPPTGIILKIIKARIMPELGYDDRNMRLGRRLSPALMIYKMQVTSVLSILLRMSGFAMTLGVWAVGLTGLCSKRHLSEWAEELKKCEMSRNLVSGAKFVLIFPFAYHVVAGTRHLIWQLDMFLTKPAIYATGYAAVVLTVLLAAGMTVLKTGEEIKKDVVDLTQAEKKNKEEAKKKEKQKAQAKKAKEEPPK